MYTLEELSRKQDELETYLKTWEKEYPGKDQLASLIFRQKNVLELLKRMKKTMSSTGIDRDSINQYYSLVLSTYYKDYQLQQQSLAAYLKLTSFSLELQKAVVNYYLPDIYPPEQEIAARVPAQPQPTFFQSTEFKIQASNPQSYPSRIEPTEPAPTSSRKRKTCEPEAYNPFMSSNPYQFKTFNPPSKTPKLNTTSAHARQQSNASKQQRNNITERLERLQDELTRMREEDQPHFLVP
ncbi:hypothetical protein Lnau_1703 [Legionella nautarum]|uniref:Uncharacterized protein n=1 Tax=Legionella nautarum TaxID=45070 RepID=A0A0W0WWP8_9GAMM|nr:hypothetical protein [Legionella nautarum]KTD36719.1 hypothetical protein Lnau_1703 [Legionella nautarum]